MGIFTGRQCEEGETVWAEGDDKSFTAKGGELVPDLTGRWLCLPFDEQGEIIQVKARSRKADGTKLFTQIPGREKTFYNANVLYDPGHMYAMTEELDATPLVITEGEFDCITAIMAGHATSVSVPNGAGGVSMERDEFGRLKEIPDDTRDLPSLAEDNAFSYLGRHIEALTKIRRFIIATDADEAGQRLAKELVRRLGAARCARIAYPDEPVVADPKTGALRPVKDLDEVRQHFGLDRVRELIQSAKSWPVANLYTIDDFKEEELDILEIGLSPEFDAAFKIYPSAFIPLTGVPNTGKSELAKQISVLMAQNHGWHTAIFPGEEMVKPFLVDSLKTKYLGKPKDAWTPEEAARAEDFVRLHYAIIAPDPRHEDDADITLDKMLELAAISVFRYGTRLLIIDPWNEIDHERDTRMSLTEYVGAAIRKIKKFAKYYGVAVIVVAHPKKVEGQPTLYDISDCYSEDTEVLTKRGWLRHAEIVVEDEVMGFDLTTQNLDWANPSRVVSYDHDGEMVRFKGYGYDLLVSPNHRMVVKPAWKDPKGTQGQNSLGRPTKHPKGIWSFTTAQEIGRGNFIMPKAGNAVPGDNPDRLIIDGKIFPAEPFCELVGWWLAEGFWQSQGVSLCQAVGEKADHIDHLIETCGLTATRAVRPDPRGFQTMVTWYFGVKTNPEFVRWIREKAGRGSAEKRVPYPIFSLSNRLKAALIQGYIDGDGHRPSARDGLVATTTSRRLSDDLMRLAVEVGMPVCGHERTPTSPNHAVQYQINFGREERRQVALRGARNCSIEQYTGKIWCLTVPTGAYVVRRNGKVTICGNSAHWYNKADLAIILDIAEDKDGRIDPYSSLRDAIIAKVRFNGVTGQKGRVPLDFDLALRTYGAIGKPKWGEVRANF